MATKGQKVNPFSVAMTRTTTLDEFTASYWRVELRRGDYDGATWIWLRATCVKVSNYKMGETEKIQCAAGTVYGLPYGSGNNGTYGSIRCSAAICVGKLRAPVVASYTGGPVPYVETRPGVMVV